MNGLELFSYDDQPVRVVTIDGDPWFVLADLCAVLEISNPSMVAQRLDRVNLRQAEVENARGQMRQTVIVSEAGMYEVVIRSDKPEAVIFRRWITSVVLPSIRKTGSYGRPVMEIPSHAEALRGWADAIEQTQIAQQRIAELEPDARAWQILVNSAGDCSVGDAAKAMCTERGIQIGRNRLFVLLGEWGWIYRAGSRDREAWRAYQSQIETGRLVERLNPAFQNRKTGEIEMAAPTLRITAKGLDAIYRRLTTQLQAVGA